MNDDIRWTMYALDELDDLGRQSCERELFQAPERLHDVIDTRRVAGMARAALLAQDERSDADHGIGQVTGPWDYAPLYQAEFTGPDLKSAPRGDADAPKGQVEAERDRTETAFPRPPIIIRKRFDASKNPPRKRWPTWVGLAYAAVGIGIAVALVLALARQSTTPDVQPGPSVAEVPSTTSSGADTDGGTLWVELVPEDARLVLDAGEVVHYADGRIGIRGLKVGARVLVIARYPGYETLSQREEVGPQERSIRVTLGAPQDVVAVPTDGYVDIQAVPWAKVFIDGKPFGTTPFRRLRLRPGEHTITFKKGAVRNTRVIQVRSGKVDLIRVDMTGE